MAAGTARAIAEFYKRVFHARIETPTSGESVVYVGPGTKFRFTENAALGPVTNKVTVAHIVPLWNAFSEISSTNIQSC